MPYFSHETEKYIKASKSPICLDWEVSSSQDMTGPVVSSGRAYTTSDIDYTVKVRALQHQDQDKATWLMFLG